MKTDSLFYELFRFDPHTLFQLLRLNLPEPYTFESITIKTTEKRLDGLFRPVDGQGPDVFLEVQAYPDPKIYWRLFREITTYYEQSPEPSTSFLAIVLFLNKTDDYGPGELAVWEQASPPRLIRAYLEDCLQALPEAKGALTVLRPLILPSPEHLPGSVAHWVKELKQLSLPGHRQNFLLELLEYTMLSSTTLKGDTSHVTPNTT